VASKKHGAKQPENSNAVQHAPAREAKAGTPPDKVDIGVLHGLRALFVLFVCNFHIWQQGWLGQYATVLGVRLDFDFWTRASYVFVDGMILMSGFLLYLPHARRAVYQTPVPATGRFYVSRITRIVPSYLASVLIMLFCVALPKGSYRDGAAMGLDIVTHLTFTFTFFRETYVYTPLNVVLWTVAIEMQFYLIFPLLARAMRKAPAVTLCLMGAAGIVFRVVLAASVPDLMVLINQLPAFLDVYALGMLGAIVYVRLDRRLAAAKRGEPLRLWVRAGAVLLFAAGVYALQLILRIQSTNGLISHEQLRLSQWATRLPLAGTFLVLILSAAFLPRVLQKPLDNRLMRFLATISFNLYIWHQALSVLISRGLYPQTLHSDLMLQQSFTLLCYSLSIVVAMAATWGVEKPAACALERLYQKHIAHKGADKP
jgi:peptidoglycan/LPS O-acetylase OafA/YrhL